MICVAKVQQAAEQCASRTLQSGSQGVGERQDRGNLTVSDA